MINPLTQEPITNDQLKSISALAEKQKSLEQVIEETEKALSTLQDQLRDIQEVKLPNAMLEIGMESFSLADGTKITVSKFYSGSVTNPEAYDWLRKQGHDDIIKNQVIVAFGKGEDERANTLLAELIKSHYNPDHKISIHPQTLKSFIKERIEGGESLPAEYFAIFVGNRAKITMAKSK